MKYPLVLAALVLAAAPPLSAQEARPLPLADALRLAEENNPAYRRALTEIGTAEADVRRSQAAYLPTLSLSVGTGGAYSRVRTGTDPFGQPVVRDDALEAKTSSAQQRLSLGNVTLFDAGERLSVLRAARAGVAATRADVGTEALRMRGEVIRRYWTAARAAATIALEERLMDAATERLAATRELVRVGVRGPIDVLTAEVAVAEQQQALDRARGEAVRAQIDLGQSMGVLPDVPLRLTDEPPVPWTAGTVDAAPLVARALASHPRMARVWAGERQAEQQLRAARSARWPRLSLSAEIARRQQFRDYSGLYETTPLDQSASLGLSVSIPLFTQLQTSYAIQAARARQDAAHETTRGERLAAERDVRAALADADNAARAAEGARRTLELNRRRLDLAQEQYRVGAITLTVLTDAVESAARAERAALAARYEFATALATLEERVGGPVTP